MNKYSYLFKQHIFFGIGVMIKLYTIFTYSPEILSNLFAPFINHFLLNPFQNPYDYFYQINRLDIFPYGTLMIVFLGWIQGIFYMLTDSVSSTIPFMLALFVFDTALYIILVKKLNKYKIWILLLYWLSPLVYYITYIHGQLDVIPTLFLILAFYFLDYRLGFVALFLGISVAIKTNNLLVIPFFLIYLYKSHTSISNWVKYCIYLCFPFIMFNGFLLNSLGFQNIVLFNEVQGNLLNIYLAFDSINIYFVPILYGFLLFKFFSFTYIVKDLFILFTTLTFTLVTLFLSPQPGWYYWIIPLIIYSIVKYDKILIIAYILWTFTLTIFFISPNSFIYTSIVFIQLTLLSHLYFKIIKKYTNSKILYHPYFIGIAGDSGTGKTQLSQSIYNFFGEKFSIMFCGDDLHKWERGDENWQSFTHLNPIAQNLHTNIKDFIKLKQGKKISRIHYDHDTGKFKTINNLISKNIVIHEGLHSLYLPRERGFYNLKIFIDPQRELYHQWKISRDVTDRGYTIEKVIENISKRLPDKEKYIDIQREYADIVISYYQNDKDSDRLGLKIFSDMLIDLDPLLEHLNQIPQCQYSIEIQEFQQILDVNLLNPVSADTWREILLDLSPEIANYPFTINFNRSDYEGFILLFIIFYIFTKEKVDVVN